MKSERDRQNSAFKIPPHIKGIRHLRCVCGATMNDEHVRLPQWLKVHRNCVKLMASGERKLCKDCAHRVIKESGMMMGGSYSKCDRPTDNINWVDGSKELLFCETEREEGDCGPGAKFFNAKPVEKKAEGIQSPS